MFLYRVCLTDTHTHTQAYIHTAQCIHTTQVHTQHNHSHTHTLIYTNMHEMYATFTCM